MAVARTEVMRPHGTTDVAAVVVVFNLDDLSTEIGQVLRAKRTRPVLFNRDDAHTGQQARLNGFGLSTHIGFRSITCLAMMMRCISLVPSPINSKGESRYKRSTLYSLE